MTRINLVPNPSFKNGDITRWAVVGSSTIVASTAEYFIGSHSLYVTTDSSPNTGVATSTTQVSVAPAQQYMVSAYVKLPADADFANLKLLLSWYTDVSGATQVGSTTYSEIYTVYPSDGWLRLSYLATAPSGANGLKVGVVNAEAVAVNFYLDAVMVEQDVYLNAYTDDLTQEQENKFVNDGLRPLPNPYITGMELNADVILNGLVLNTVDENNVVWVCTGIEGWWTMPEVDMQEIPRGLGDGSYDVNGRYASRNVTLTGSILPPSPSYVPAARDKLVRAIDLVRKNGWLLTDEKPVRGSRVRLAGAPSIEVVNPRGRIDFNIPLKAVDPVKYEWVVGEPEGYQFDTVGVGSTVNLVNNGNTNVAIQLVVNGFLNSGTTIRNNTTNQEIEIINDVGGENSYVGDITQVSRSGNLATIIANTTYPFVAGDLISVLHVGTSGFNTNTVATIASVTEVDGDTLSITYENTGTDVGNTSQSPTGVLALGQAEFLEIDTYERSVAYIGLSGYRSKLATLVDWIYLQPGTNEIEIIESASPTAVSVTNKALTDNIATLTFGSYHNLPVGSAITVTGVDSTFNGTYNVASTPSKTTITYSKTASNVVSTASSGSVLRAGDGLIDVLFKSGWLA
jgi:hypothetical protein